MHLSSIFKEYGINIEKTKIVRHPLNNEEVRNIYEKGLIEEYQSCQSRNVFDNCEYIVSFIGTVGTEAKFIGIYKIKKNIVGNSVKKMMPKNYPYPKHFDESHTYYSMEKTALMSDLINKLIIDWGKSTIAWVQWANNDKEVLSIASREEIPFPGYENIILSYSDLGNIVEGDIRYQKWIDALSNINGIYLICDKQNNKQYIGSTYNEIGILGRWSDYYKTHDGGDIGIKEHLKKYPEAYIDFQFTILKVLSKPISINEATQAESLYKNKLCTRNKNYGLNNN